MEEELGARRYFPNDFPRRSLPLIELIPISAAFCPAFYPSVDEQVSFMLPDGIASNIRARNPTSGLKTMACILVAISAMA